MISNQTRVICDAILSSPWFERFLIWSTFQPKISESSTHYTQQEVSQSPHWYDGTDWMCGACLLKALKRSFKTRPPPPSWKVATLPVSAKQLSVLCFELSIQKLVSVYLVLMLLVVHISQWISNEVDRSASPRLQTVNRGSWTKLPICCCRAMIKLPNCLQTSQCISPHTAQQGHV